MVKFRSDLTARDCDAALKARLSEEVKVTACCGFNFKEMQGGKLDKTLRKYQDPYFGLNFDIQL
jgi:hypothetical protein